MSAQDLPRKLALAAEALGCRTQKELLNRLLLVNPDTSFDPVRAYKWLKGRSTPRDPGVYQDLADALELAESGEVVRTCSFEAFAAMVANRSAPGRDRVLQPARDASVLSHLDGGYVLYMASFSNFPTPKIFRITLEIISQPSGGAEMRMNVPRPDHLIHLRSSLTFTGGAINAFLVNEAFGSAIFVWFADPAPPVRLAGGLIGSTAGYVAVAIPTCSRMVLVRAPDERVDLESDRFYLDFDDAALAADIDAIGHPDIVGRAAARPVLDFLTQPLNKPVLSVPTEASEALLTALDGAGGPTA